MPRLIQPQFTSPLEGSLNRGIQTGLQIAQLRQAAQARQQQSDTLRQRLEEDRLERIARGERFETERADKFKMALLEDRLERIARGERFEKERADKFKMALLEDRMARERARKSAERQRDLQEFIQGKIMQRERFRRRSIEDIARERMQRGGSSIAREGILQSQQILNFLGESERQRLGVDIRDEESILNFLSRQGRTAVEALRRADPRDEATESVRPRR